MICNCRHAENLSCTFLVLFFIKKEEANDTIICDMNMMDLLTNCKTTS